MVKKNTLETAILFNLLPKYFYVINTWKEELYEQIYLFIYFLHKSNIVNRSILSPH